jgi:uncharacterized protein with GYD domain
VTVETFVLMTKLSPELMGDPKGRKAAGKAWLDKVAKQCPDVKWLAHYALLGRYDFMDVYTAPDAQTAHKVSYISRAEGAVEAESWHAVGYDDYLSLIADA